MSGMENWEIMINQFNLLLKLLKTKAMLKYAVINFLIRSIKDSIKNIMTLIILLSMEIVKLN